MVERVVVDAVTLRAILARALPVLTPIAQRLCAHRSDADDLVQDTLETAMIRGLPAELKNPLGWLVTTMHHRFIDRCRRDRRAPIHEPLGADHERVAPNASEPPRGWPDDEPAWSGLELADLQRALAEVGAPFREVYERHSFGGQSYGQIAASLHISTVTVGTRLSRVRLQLRKALIARREATS